MKRYTDSHEWIEETGKMGVTAYAQKELGEVVYVEFPKVGTVVQAGDVVAVLESTKAAADIYSPVSGTIAQVNEEVRANPSLINGSAEEKGWLVKLDLTKPSELETLHTSTTYLSLVEFSS